VHPPEDGRVRSAPAHEVPEDDEPQAAYDEDDHGQVQQKDSVSQVFEHLRT
jgi:hypothetical protein